MAVAALYFVSSCFVFLFSIVTCWHFSRYLSSHDQSLLTVMQGNSSYETEPITWKLLNNLLLLLLFGAQHSCMARFKSFLKLGSLQRTFYIFITSLALQVIMYNWKPIYNTPLWCVDTSSNSAIWWAFSLCHWLCWLAIYGGVLVMDMPELLGVKQVYYELQGWTQPVHRKSRELQRLYGHMRHPGFTAFLLILWCHPVMRLDRLLLALCLPLYMVLAFKVDEKDHQYVKRQQIIKNRELLQLF